MKLHLPTALFALAVLPAVAFAETAFDPNVTVGSQMKNFGTISPETRNDDKVYINIPMYGSATGKGTFLESDSGVVLLQQEGGKKDLFLSAGSKVGALDSNGEFITPEGYCQPKVLYVDGDINISAGAEVKLQGENGQLMKAGLIAKNVTIEAGEHGEKVALEAVAARFESLTVKGGTVSLNEDGGGGSMYGAGVMTNGHPGIGTHPSLETCFAFSNVSITNGLTVENGTVVIGRPVLDDEDRDNCLNNWFYWRSNIGGDISQTGGELTLEGKTYISSGKISQANGTMTIAYDAVNADYLRFEKGEILIQQTGGTLGLNGMMIRGNSRDESMKLVVEQIGDGTINMALSAPNRANAYKGSYFTSEEGKESLISQSGSGKVNINSDYTSPTFNVEQKGEGSVTLKEHGVLRSSVVSINDKSTFKIAAGGKLMLNEGAQLNLTVGSERVGLQVANGGSIMQVKENGGSITSASPDSTVVVNVLLTEEAMKSKISMDELAKLLDGGSLTFSVNIAQFGTDADAEAFAGILTVTGNAQVLTYTPDVATFSGEGAVPTDLAITVTGFKSAGGMVQAQVSATRYTAPVPEPATATLSLLALAGLCARRRRK